MKKNGELIWFCILFFVLALFLGCGGGSGGSGGSSGAGGGSGGGGGSDDAPIVYTGLETRALITSQNAESFFLGVLTVGMKTTGLGTDEVNDQGETETLLGPTIVGMYELARQISQNRIDIEDDVVEGNCGGYKQNDITISDNGTFTGRIAFYDYCNAQVITNGAMRVTGEMIDDEVVNLTFYLDAIKMHTDIEDLAFGGIVMFEYIDDQMALIVADYRFKKGYKVYQYKNLAIDLNAQENGGTTAYEMFFSGSYYSPDHGYVNAQTRIHIRFTDNDMTRPISGQLRLLGNQGTSGGATSALCDVMPVGTYTIQADTTGDGVYDWISGTRSW